MWANVKPHTGDLLSGDDDDADRRIKSFATL